MLTHHTEGLPVEREVIEAAERIRGLMHSTRRQMLEIGAELNRIKESVGHGSWSSWLATEFNLSERTAQNYMSAAARFGSESESVSYLPDRTIYLLASKSTPDQVRSGILTRIKGGDRPSPEEIKNLLAHQREKARKDRAAREEAEVAKMTPEQRELFLRKRTKKARARELQRTQLQRECEEQQARMEVDGAQRHRAAEAAASLLVEALEQDALRRFIPMAEAAGWEVAKLVRHTSEARASLVSVTGVE